MNCVRKTAQLRSALRMDLMPLPEYLTYDILRARDRRAGLPPLNLFNSVFLWLAKHNKYLELALGTSGPQGQGNKVGCDGERLNLKA